MEHKSKIYENCPCEVDLREKKHAQRLVRHLKNEFKRNYIEMTLNKFKNDSKKLWKNIRDFWPSSKNKNSKIANINTSFIPLEQANIVNHHFSQVGVNTLSSIVTDLDIDNYLPIFMSPIFDLRSTDTTRIAAGIDKL